MTVPLQPNPHDLRITARQLNYPNRAFEDAAVKAVDDAVLDKVRFYEAQLVGSARDLMEAEKVHEVAAKEVVELLNTELRYPLLDGATPTAELAAQYERLRGQALAVKRSLMRAENDAAALASQAADPYKAVTALWEKWPNIRPILV
jgi:hypothetical protein